MPAARPMELAASLGKEVEAFFHTITRTDAFDKFWRARLLRECDGLQKANVLDASLLKALIYSATGDVDEMDRWLVNAERNGGVDRARLERVRYMVNHGLGSQALELLPSVLERSGGMPLMSVAVMAAANGSFNAIVRAVQASQDRGEVLQMTPTLDVARRAAAIMGQLGVSDADVAAMIDVAGDFLRVEKLLWQNECIDITLLDAGQGGPALGLAYRIGVSPQQAARMGWALTDELVRRDLDRPGVAVDFLGTASAQTQAA